MKGKVTLVGAGPGDEGLITVKGKNALLSAEVVVYDRLVGEEILALIPDSAEKIDVGKESSHHKIPQEEINKILLNKAQEGKNVVRLKGGDCYLFGRGAEELELLCENGIDFTVIPGITSALAVPAYAGIPITHREFASSVHIITGHAKKGGRLHIDFESYRKIGGTLVFLMGVANMEFIINGLVCAAFDVSTPCAVIEKGTTWGQKKYVGTLKTILDVAKDAKSPSVIIVGEVAGLSDKYDWFSNQPLFGKTVVVTRPKERVGTLAEKLRRKGAHVIECPCIRTKSLMTKELADKIVTELSRHNRVVFTSPMGVKSVMEGLYKTGRDVRVFGSSWIAAIGKATADELLKYGICADAVPENYDGKGLAEILKEKTESSDELLLLRAKKNHRTLNEMLENYGISYTELAVYETEECALRDVTNEEIDYVTFTSASTVRGFMEGHKNINKDAFTAVCIGETTAAEAQRYGLNCITAAEARIDSMIKLITEDIK